MVLCGLDDDEEEDGAKAGISMEERTRDGENSKDGAEGTLWSRCQSQGLTEEVVWCGGLGWHNQLNRRSVGRRELMVAL